MSCIFSPMCYNEYVFTFFGQMRLVVDGGKEDIPTRFMQKNVDCCLIYTFSGGQL